MALVRGYFVIEMLLPWRRINQGGGLTMRMHGTVRI